MLKQDFLLSSDSSADCRAYPLRRLGLFTPFDDYSLDEMRAIRTGTRHLKHGEVIYREGDPLSHAFLLFDGYAVRYRLLSSGERQVLQFIGTGDLLCNLEDGEKVWPDSAEVVGHAVLCSLSAAGLQTLFHEEIIFAHQIALLRSAEKRSLEEQIMDIGRRSSFDRVARLLLELFAREQVHGRTRGTQCYFPFRQNDIGDALGLSSAHVSRVYAKLRKAGLMTIDDRWLTILDLECVKRRVDYEPSCLHGRPPL